MPSRPRSPTSTTTSAPAFRRSSTHGPSSPDPWMTSDLCRPRWAHLGRQRSLVIHGSGLEGPCVELRRKAGADVVVEVGDRGRDGIAGESALLEDGEAARTGQGCVGYDLGELVEAEAEVG